MSLRPAPLLQSERSFSVSSDNGTTTPLPVPYNDFWDINTVPNAGLTQVYQITNISEYQGRVIYVNKTQNTAGATIRISLPGGYTFSSTGTQHYDFPDAPTQLIISISTSAVVAIQTGGSGVGPNSTLINYQVPDLSTGSGNVISLISDTNGNNYIDTTFGGELTIASAGDVNISTNQIMNFQASQGYAIPIAPTKTLSITGANGIVNAATANINLPNLANVSTVNAVNFNTANGRLTYAPKENGTTINYQVADLDTGTGNIITTIGDTNLFTSVECNGTDINLVGPGDINLGGLENNLNGLNGVFITGTVPTSTNNRYLLSFDSTTKQIERANRYLDANTAQSNLATNANGNFPNSITVPANTITAAGQSLRFLANFDIDDAGAGPNTILAYGLTTALPPPGTSPSGCFTNLGQGWEIGTANFETYSIKYEATVTCYAFVASPGLSLFRISESLSICDHGGPAPTYIGRTFASTQGIFQMDVGAANVFTGNISANAGTGNQVSSSLQKVWFE